MKSKAELEREINASRYFSIAGEGMEAALAAEKRRLIDSILEYCRNYWYASPQRSGGLFLEKSGEMYETITACLKPGRFKPDSGVPFVHYLRRAIGHAIHRDSGEPDDKERQFYENQDEEGSVFSEVETLESPYESPDAALRAIERRQFLLQTLDLIDEEYKSLQERCRTPYRQTLLTEQYRDIISAVENLPTGYTFINYNWLKDYPCAKEAPSMTEIAAMFGKLLPDASRLVKNFNVKIQRQALPLVLRYGIRPRQLKKFVVNLHLLDNCNFRCKQCFARFDAHKILPVEQWKDIVDNVLRGVEVTRFNLAGGEPLIYPGLASLIDYIAEKGARVSIITNGFLLDEKLINSFKGKVSMIGLSIDSVVPETLRTIGRATPGGEVLDRDRCVRICGLIKAAGMELKINTVVSTLNKDEDMSSFIREARPDRWKIIKMKPFANEKYSNACVTPSDADYERFAAAHSAIPHIAEREMKNAYIMVDAFGSLVDTGSNDNTQAASLLNEDFVDSFARLSFDYDLYEDRYTASKQAAPKALCPAV